MERFLERLSLSTYRNHFILKGGMLVASMVGLSARTTMDIDTTIKELPLTETAARRILEEIIDIDIQDGVTFRIMNENTIMEEHDYPGIRFTVEAYMGKMRQPITIDLSTGDVITPHAIEYSYLLMLENREISIMTYNVETMLAEKLETIIARGTANTRMRDFYDIHILCENTEVDDKVLKQALLATSTMRETFLLLKNYKNILKSIFDDKYMGNYWNNFKAQSGFVRDIEWQDILRSVMAIAARGLE
jgi:predicted nucleotidyltransferase component of viral defense system